VKTFQIAWPIFRQMLPVEPNAVYYYDRGEEVVLMIPKNGILLECVYQKQGGMADDIFVMEHLSKAIRVDAIIDDNEEVGGDDGDDITPDDIMTNVPDEGVPE
jgi:hypothetical protein